MVDEKREGTIVVAAFNFKFPKYFAPFPQDELEQVYIKFNKGDVLPDDIAERCEHHAPDMIRNLTEKEIHELRKKDAEERGEKYKEEPIKVNKEKKKTLEDYPEKDVKRVKDLKKKEQLDKLEELGVSKIEINELSKLKESDRMLKILELE